MRLANVISLGIKELRSLGRDPFMLGLIFYSFTIAIYSSATAVPETLNNAPIAIVDEDHSPLSERISGAFYPPTFSRPVFITLGEMDARMDAGRDTFALVIPTGFQRDMLAGRGASIQLNVDATRVAQAFTGSGYIQSVVRDEVARFLARQATAPPNPAELVLRVRFNPQLSKAWFGSVMELINQVTMLSIILTGAALIREREHGTIEHLLVMPITPVEIIAAKIWSMGLVVLIACILALLGVVEGVLAVPIHGSIPLFLIGVALHLFATTSMGIVLGTVARSMPQLGLLFVLVLLPMQMLSGGTTPRENMPDLIQTIMLAAPTTHFIALAQAILFRGAGWATVWPQMTALASIGTLLFGYAALRFRRSISGKV